MKKFISKIMAVIGIMLCMIPMAACQDEPAHKRRETYIIVYDGLGNERGVYEGRENTFEYEYNPNVVYHFSYKAFFKDNNEEDDCRDLSTIRGDDVGKHSMSIYYGNGTVVYVVIKEKPRLTPEVSFDPMGAVEYIENERYVYEYDGEEHYPHIKLSYNGEDLPLKNSGVLGWKYCETPHGSRGVEVGVYVMVYSVVDENYVHEYNKNKYESVGAEISIVIIPSSK